MKSPKTTIAGVLTALIATGNAVLLILDGDAATNPDWAVVVATWATAIGLIFAGDDKPKTP